MQTLINQINNRLTELTTAAEIVRSDLITGAIRVIEEEFGSMDQFAPEDRFAIILSKIVIVFEDHELDVLCSVLTDSAPLLAGTQSMQTTMKIS